MHNWGSVSQAADVLSILSFFLSCITLIIAGGIRKTLLKKIEKNDFKERSNYYIAQLKTYRQMFYEDKDVINDRHYANINKTLTEILDDFPNVLPLKTRINIKRLRSRITAYLQDSEKNITDENCANCLHSIESDLNREARII